MFHKVLVANRGEIAIRIFRTLREMGIGTVAVYSEADRDAAFVGWADDAYLIGPGPAAQSYLMSETIVRTALRAGAEAVHPGFGFLAENAAFARACEAAGLVFVGPPAEAIEIMGSKISARAAMERAGVPVIPGTNEAVETVEDAVAIAERIGYPIAVKAAAGGGGKGIEVARSDDELRRGYESARRQGKAYFADDTVFLEHYLDNPRHIEVQVLADSHGSVIHLGERDCSIQRRHQKIIEETPSPAVTPEMRERIGAIGVEAARAVGYVNAGTVEGLLAGGTYYFLEMNTRLQVEHTITEEVTGLDLVREQLLIATGEPLSLRQEDVELRGHSIQCRINAEDPARDFIPTPGRITRYREPSGPGVRVDSGVVEGSVISDLYDPMIAKLIVRDADREHARRRMLRALDEFEIGGVHSLIPIHRAILEHPDFVQGNTLHEFVEGGGYQATLGEPETVESEPPAAESEAVSLPVEVDGRRFEVTVVREEDPGRTRLRRRRAAMADRAGRHAGAADTVVSPMQGTVLRIGVAAGEAIEPGQVLVVVEAMKMENEIVAHHSGTVEQVDVSEGDQVTSGQTLLRLGVTILLGVSNLIDSGWAAWLPAELADVYEAQGASSSTRRAVAKRLAEGPDAERRSRWERFALVCPSRVDLPPSADGLTVEEAEHLLDQLGLGGAEPEPVEVVLTLDHEQLRDLEKVRSAREIGDVETPVEALPSLEARFGGVKVGRNDPCPCGSGKKFKRCHGG